MLEKDMLDQLRSVIDGIPLDVVAFVGPPAIWAKVAWASPFVKTYRHGISGLLSLLTGLLMAVALHSDDAIWPIYFIAAAISMVAMFPSCSGRGNRMSADRPVLIIKKAGAFN